MYACVLVCINKMKQTCMYIHIHTRTYIYIYTGSYAHLYWIIYAHTYIYIYMYVCMYVCMYICMNNIHTRMYICMYDVFKKNSILTEVIVIQEGNDPWRGRSFSFFFFFNALLAFNSLIPASVPLFEAPLKFLFWHRVKLRRRISFNVLHILKSYPWDKFSVQEIRQKSRTRLFLTSMGRWRTCTTLCFTKKHFVENLWSLVW